MGALESVRTELTSDKSPKWDRQKVRSVRMALKPKSNDNVSVLARVHRTHVVSQMTMSKVNQLRDIG
jgi:hypothetical protein